MADPTPSPAPVSNPVVTTKTWAAILSLLALIGIGLIGYEGYRAYERFHPAPAPAPSPKPLPPAPAPDPSPVAAVTGMFWAAPMPGVQGMAAGEPAPLGMFVLDASKSVSTKPIRWKVKGPAITPIVMSPSEGLAGSIAHAYPSEPGTYRFHAIARGTTKGECDADAATWTYTVSPPAPPPDPPKPPPDPTPGPPIPPPAPPDKPAPIAGDGLRVLFVYESADLGKYPKDQITALYSGAVRDYLDATCPKVNAVPEYRLFDQNADMANESKTWQDAMKRDRKSLPWIVVSNGKTGFEGPLPASLADTLTLIKKYGEAK